MLKTQLILKNVITLQDWEEMGDHIQYDFLYDNQFAELKESEMIQSRLTNLATIEPYIGKFYSTEYVRKKVLRQTDQEIIEIDAQIEDEITKGIIANPAAVDPVTGQPIADPMSVGSGAPTEPDFESQGSATEADGKAAEL